MKEIEVLKAGIANDGREVSEDTINEIYRNTLEATAEGFIPKVKIGGNHRDAYSRRYNHRFKPEKRFALCRHRAYSGSLR